MPVPESITANPVNQVLAGDCADVMAQLDADSVDLVVTSPPYAQQRASTYGGVPVEQYIDWFLDRALQFFFALKPTGSFVLNIKEHTHNGERHPYVMRLVLSLRAEGWKLVDEFIWHKPNPVPGRWNGRLKDGWEHLYHFTRDVKGYKFYPDAVRQPLAEKSKKCYEADVHAGGYGMAATGSGFNNAGARISKKIKAGAANSNDLMTTALPSNVLRAGVGCGIKQKDHPAVFPPEIAEFFIKLLTDKGDLVLDPFCGSGTTCVAAKRLGRDYIGIDVSSEYCALARQRLEQELA